MVSGRTRDGDSWRLEYCLVSCENIVLFTQKASIFAIIASSTAAVVIFS